MSADDHGTNSTYVNHRCRCDLCKAAHTAAQTVINKKLRAQYAAQGLTTRGRRPSRKSTYDRWREGSIQ